MNEAEQLGEIILYKTEDGRTRLECRFADESIWLTQALMAELFQVTPQNITLHLKAIYDEGELEEEATCKEYLQVRREGGRAVSRCRGWASRVIWVSRATPAGWCCTPCAVLV